MAFQEPIAIELTLTIGATSVSVPGAHVKRFAVELTAYGFRAEADFWSPALYQSDSTLFDSFNGLDLVTADMSIQAQYNMPDQAPDPIRVKGLCTRKSVIEQGYGQISGTDAYHRWYHIEFADAARVLWTQHFPQTLITESTLEDLIDQEKPDAITLAYSFDETSTQYDMLCLALDDEHGEASFYDFLMWLMRMKNGVFTYDSAKDSYSIAAEKASLTAPATVSEYQLEEVEIAVPETIRYNVSVLNAVADSSDNQAITQTQAVTGVRRDRVLRTPLPADVDARVTLETARLVARQPTPILRFNTFPTFAVTPGSGVTFARSSFTRHSSFLTGDHRVIGLSVSGRAVDQDRGADLQGSHTPHQVELSVRLEPSAETYIELPAFKPPCWPLLVEGKVLSTSDDTTDKTYQVNQDDDTSLYSYSVNIPLWDKNIDAPLDPMGMPGHFFFPAFKAQRVLVALYFTHAAIVRYLDYGARTQLAMDTQGNHILFGKNETSETSMRYAYEDGTSLFEVKRVMDSDHVTLQMKDGLLYLEVKEEDSES